MRYHTVTVPGHFRNRSYLDLETQKVESGHVCYDGWILKRRWAARMAGIARDGVIHLIGPSREEEKLLAAISEAVGSGPVVYAATRQFDEMILKGRFTNARRAHEPLAFYPRMPRAERLQWANVYKALMEVRRTVPRSEDVASAGVIESLNRGDQGYRLAMIHNLRDVAELILADGEGDAKCRAWCKAVLWSANYASLKIFGDGLAQS